MDNIAKQSKLLYKSIKGDVSAPNIIKYLEKRGYSVVFFNTPKGDKLLETCGLEIGDTKAFTVCGTTKTVFVDDLLHVTDKVYALLHECAHIVLSHIGNNEIHLQNKRKTENEAEAFAYKVLNYSPTRRIRNVIIAVLSSFLLIAGTYFCTEALTADSSPKTPVSAETLPEMVYITSSGAKYHDKTCYYVEDRAVAELPKEEAQKIHTSCSMCNP